MTATCAQHNENIMDQKNGFSCAAFAWYESLSRFVWWPCAATDLWHLLFEVFLNECTPARSAYADAPLIKNHLSMELSIFSGGRS